MFPFWIAHEASSSDFAYFEAAFQPIKIMLICEFLVERLFTMAKSFIANYFTAIVSEAMRAASGELHNWALRNRINLQPKFPMTLNEKKHANFNKPLH